MREDIFVKGARVHNLKNIDVTIPRNKLVVFTGLSGSGKSSLAFDTIFAEGQRRYMESLSSYARQFLGQMDKPDVDRIDGLSPAISIDQKTTSNNPRSTVGTVTEIYDYLRLLYARIGEVHCPKCGKKIEQQTVDQIADRVMTAPSGAKMRIIAPVVRGRKGEFSKQLEQYKKNGYMRVIVDGSDYTLDEEIIKEFFGASTVGDEFFDGSFIIDLSAAERPSLNYDVKVDVKDEENTGNASYAYLSDGIIFENIDNTRVSLGEVDTVDIQDIMPETEG